ncbi:hypothetical protein HDU91_002531, partial [Kappamyces sp. JEL0680]
MDDLVQKALDLFGRITDHTGAVAFGLQMLAAAKSFMEKLNSTEKSKLRKVLYELPNTDAGLVEADREYRASKILELARTGNPKTLETAIKLADEDGIDEASVCLAHAEWLFTNPDSTLVQTFHSTEWFLTRHFASIMPRLPELQAALLQSSDVKLSIFYTYLAQVAESSPSFGLTALDRQQLLLRQRIIDALQSLRPRQDIPFQRLFVAAAGGVPGFVALWTETSAIFGVEGFVQNLDSWMAIQPVSSLAEAAFSERDARAAKGKIVSHVVRDFVSAVPWSDLDEPDTIQPLETIVSTFHHLEAAQIASLILDIVSRFRLSLAARTFLYDSCVAQTGELPALKELDTHLKLISSLAILVDPSTGLGIPPSLLAEFDASMGNPDSKRTLVEGLIMSGISTALVQETCSLVQIDALALYGSVVEQCLAALDLDSVENIVQSVCVKSKALDMDFADDGWGIDDTDLEIEASTPIALKEIEAAIQRMLE